MYIIEFIFNYYNCLISLPLKYLIETKIGIKEILLEEALKKGIHLNIDNIIIYDLSKNKCIESINEIITSDTKKYKIIIKPIICDTEHIMISKF
jgi:hypothetical protein